MLMASLCLFSVSRIMHKSCGHLLDILWVECSWIEKIRIDCCLNSWGVFKLKITSFPL